MNIDMTEELAEYFIFILLGQDIVIFSPTEAVYCNLLEVSRCAEIVDNVFTARWKPPVGGGYAAGGVILSVGERSIIETETLYIRLSTVLHHSAAIGKLLRDTVDFEKLKRLCIENVIFTEKEIETEMLKRAVKR